MLDKMLPEVTAIFAMLGIVPVKAECLYHNNTVEYYAFCDEFDEVEAGLMTPEYQLRIETHNGALAKARFERI